MIAPLPLKARRCVDAAEGWLELGDWQSANQEVEAIELKLRDHPEVLKMRVEIHSTAAHWELVIEAAEVLSGQLPDQSYPALRLAYALHELKRTREAWNTLLPIADKYPEEWVIPYNLACYAAQLGNLKEAREWLTQAYKVGDEAKLKREARKDPDLAPLWRSEDSGKSG